MPTLAEQRTAALAEMQRRGQPDVVPVISSSEQDAIIDGARRATIWIAATAYTYGQIILPTVRNGHTYKCVQAGTSAATEPEWNTWEFGEQSEGASDPQLTWRENGRDYANVYDVNAALYALWQLKAAKTAPETDFAIGQQSIKDSQLHQHCLKMAERFAPVVIA